MAAETNPRSTVPYPFLIEVSLYARERAMQGAAKGKNVTDERSETPGQAMVRSTTIATKSSVR
jgi:hypothetical protein